MAAFARYILLSFVAYGLTVLFGHWNRVAPSTSCRVSGSVLSSPLALWQHSAGGCSSAGWLAATYSCTLRRHFAGYRLSKTMLQTFCCSFSLGCRPLFPSTSAHPFMFAFSIQLFCFYLVHSSLLRLGGPVYFSLACFPSCGAHLRRFLLVHVRTDRRSKRAYGSYLGTGILRLFCPLLQNELQPKCRLSRRVWSGSFSGDIPNV